MVSVPSAEAFIESFPNQLPKIEGQPTYDKLKHAKSLLKQNAATVPSNRGGGDNGYLALTMSDEAYTAISATAFDLPEYPGASPDIPDGATGPVIARLVQTHNESLREWREFINVNAALKKQLTGCIDPVYLRSQRNRNTGFANVELRTLITYCITTYGKISPADLAVNEAAIKQPWDSATPFELIIDQIEDCQEFAEDGNQPFTDRQVNNTAYTLVFNTGSYFDECKTWNAKPANDKTWDNFKLHFLAAQEMLRMQQATSQQAGFHNANHANGIQHNGISQEMYEDTANALANLAEATATNRKALENLTNTIANLTQQVSLKDKEIQKLKDQLTKTGARNKRDIPERTDNGSYCWSHGYKVHAKHDSSNCRFQKTGHKKEATRTNNLGGSQDGKP
jgi:hypothetical protein